MDAKPIRSKKTTIIMNYKTIIIMNSATRSQRNCIFSQRVIISIWGSLVIRYSGTKVTFTEKILVGR